SYLAWLQHRSKTEALAKAQEQHLVGAAINTIADLFTDPHFVVRSPWDMIDHPHTGPVTYPGRPFIMGESPRRPAQRAALLGEHTEAILHQEFGYTSEDLARLRAKGVLLSLGPFPGFHGPLGPLGHTP